MNLFDARCSMALFECGVKKHRAQSYRMWSRHITIYTFVCHVSPWRTSDCFSFFLTSSRRLKDPVHNHWQRKTKCFTAHVSAISAVGIRKIFAISKKDEDKNNEECYVKSFPDHMANCNFFIFWFQGTRLSFSFFFKLQERIKHSYLDFCCFYTFSFQLNHCISTFSEERLFLCYFSSHLTLTSESFKLKKRHNQKGCLASRIYLSASGVRILMDRDGAMNAETYC